jgi:multisubunit Na+/H+ antiporter MnhC subunit
VFSQLFGEGRVVFELAGNHDMMVVLRDDAVHNRYRNYTIDPIDAPFGVRSRAFDGYAVPVKYHLYNPLRAPFTSGPMGVFPCHHWDDVQALDDAIDDNYRNIIVTHFPMNQVWSINTTNAGRGIREVVRRADLYLAGHLHPTVNEITRRGTTLSVTVTAFFESSTFVMPFVDQGGAGVLPVDTHDDPVILITYPLDKSHLTSRSVFNLQKFPIRAITFSDAPLYLPVYIDEAFMGQMNCSRTLRRNNRFCTLDVSGVKPGDHILRVGPQTLNFFVGTTTELTYEWANILYGPDSCIFGCFGFFLHILIYILPWWGFLSDALDNFADVMFGNPTYTPLAWYEMLVIGPLYQFSRLRKAPGILYTYCIITGVLFAVVHMYTMQMNDGIEADPPYARAYIWGVFIDNGEQTFTQYAMLATLLLIYEIFFILPAMNFIGFWFEREATYAWNCTQRICAGILVFVMLVGFVGWGVLAYLAGGWYTVLNAPIMMVMLLTFLVIGFGLPAFSRRELAKKERQDEARALVGIGRIATA